MPIERRNQQGGLALLGQRHRGGQLRPVAALAAFHLDEFRRTTPFMKRLLAMDDIRITTGSTYDNAEHLSAGFLKRCASFTKARGSAVRSYKAR